MKKALLIVCAIVCSALYVSAQQLEDVVYLKDGSIVRGIILEQVPGQTIKIQTSGGSQFVYKIENVSKMTKEPVQYQQPQYQQYQQYQQQPQYQQYQYQQSYRQPRPAPIAKAPKVRQPIDWSIRYKGEVNLGFAITGSKTDWEYDYTMSYNGDTDSESGESENIKTVFSRPLIETIHGVAIGPYFFVGAGIGLQYYCGKLKDFQREAEVAAAANRKPEAANRWNAVMLPIFADIKFMYPVNDDFIPYIDLGLGGTVACTSAINCSYSQDGGESSQKLRGGFYCNFGVGLHYKKLNVSLGLQHQGLKIAYHSEYGEYGYGGDYTVTGDTTLSTKVNAFYIKVGVNF